MERPRVRLGVGLVVLGACLGLIVWLVATSARSATSDGAYIVHGDPGADNAAMPIDALVHGRLGALPHLQTVMGLTSILWRAPFVAVATAFGAGPRATYAVGAIVCLLPLAGLVAWLLRRAPNWRQLAIAGVAGFVMIIGFSTLAAVQDGHPECLLIAALAVSAVLAAQADHRLAAAILLGLAIGTKETGLLAVPAVLFALRGGRWRAATVALAIAAATSLPLALVDPAAFMRADASIGPISTVAPMSLWWVLAPGKLPLGMERPIAAAAALGCAGVVVVLVGLGLRRLRPLGVTCRVDPLALLALCGLVRCILDPADLAYYLVAVTVPLGVWEAGVRRRWPIVSVCFWGVEAVCYGGTVLGGPLVTHGGVVGIDLFLASATLLAAYLSVSVFRPRIAVPRPVVPSALDLLETAVLAAAAPALSPSLGTNDAGHPAATVATGRITPRRARTRAPAGRQDLSLSR